MLFVTAQGATNLQQIAYAFKYILCCLLPKRLEENYKADIQFKYILCCLLPTRP